MGNPLKWKEHSLGAFMDGEKQCEPKKMAENTIVEKPKIKKLNKKNDDASFEMSEEERQHTLALAMQYQYYTESEEEEVDEVDEEDETNMDNSAW